MFRLIILLSALLVAAAIFIGYLLGKPSKDGGDIVQPKQVISIHATVKEILPAAEFVTLNYRYTSVIKDVNSKEMFGVAIPGTEKKLLAMIDGTIKLGINCKEIVIDTTRTDTLFIKFPPIKILSHELHPETAEVYDQKDGIFNKYRAADHFALEAKQKAEIELDVRANKDIITQARNSAEYSFGAFIHALPALDTIPISFRWH